MTTPAPSKPALSSDIPSALPQKPVVAVLALLVVYLVWGTTLGSIRIGVNSLPWALVPCARFLSAGILMSLFCLCRGEKLPPRKEIQKHAIAGLLLFSGGNTLVCWAVQYMTTGLGGLLVSTMPFWMLGLSAVIPPREKVSSWAIVGMLIGFSGMIILLSPHLGHPTHTPPLFWWSVLAMFANTFFWALGSVFVRKNPSPNLSLPMRVAIQNMAAGLSLIPLCLLTIPAGTVLHPSPQALWAVAYLALFGTCVAGPCYLYVMKSLPVPIASTFAYVTPVVTVLFGWLFLNEPLTEITLKGMGVILFGVISVQVASYYSSRPKKRSVATESTPASTLVEEGLTADRHKTATQQVASGVSS